MKQNLLLALGILMLPLGGCVWPNIGKNMPTNGEWGVSNWIASTPWGTIRADYIYSKERQMTNDFTHPYVMHPVTHQVYRLTPLVEGAPTPTPPR